MSMFFKFIIVVITITLGETAVKKPEWRGNFKDFKINIVTDGSYSISVNNVTWLNSARTFFFVDGYRYETGHKLNLTQTTSDGGFDRIGQWTRVNFHYTAGQSEIIASIKTYNNDSIPVVLFSQKYVNGAENTGIGNNDYTIASFPGFKVDQSTSTLGFLSYGGMMFGETERKMGNWSSLGAILNYGIKGGPLALFDKTGNTVIISSANNFMSTSMWHESFLDVDGSVHWGTMGGVDKVPSGHVVETVLFYHNEGINKAFQAWGEYLRYRYNRHDEYVNSDLTINYLGYWTDNGAFYYYNTEEKQNYQTTMLDVKSYIDQTGIPYKYVQYDSWWYYMGRAGGVKTWVPRPDVFPQGSQYLYNKTGLPVTAHNRYWASDTTYATQNGGKYKFIVELLKAVPIDENLWDDLFREGRKWGLVTYEQDWLNDEFSGMKALLTDIDLGTKWLTLMGQGAIKNGVNIQYCMSNSRHAMQTLEIPVVTQARVSNDYSPGRDQWKIGISSIFAQAMGVAPFKDTFWSTTNQSGNPYDRTEPYNGLNAVVSTLSTGPVGPGDKIGSSNVSLIMKCCNADGLILKPSKPATAIDSQIYQSAFGSGGPDGEVWTTFSNIGFIVDLHFGIILAADMHNAFSLTPSLADFGNLSGYKIFSMNHPERLSDFSDQSPVTLTPDCSALHFCLYYVSPVLKTNPEVILLGELSKWVPVSPQRIKAIEVSDDIVVTITGKPNESVSMSFTIDSILKTVTCKLGSSGTVQLYIQAMKCVAT